jgi:hypothetical protein
MAAGDAAGQNLLNDIEPLGSSWSSFGNEQIAHILLDEMTAVHRVLRNFEPRKVSKNAPARGLPGLGDGQSAVRIPPRSVGRIESRNAKMWAKSQRSAMLRSVNG